MNRGTKDGRGQDDGRDPAGLEQLLGPLDKKGLYAVVGVQLVDGVGYRTQQDLPPAPELDHGPGWASRGLHLFPSGYPPRGHRVASFGESRRPILLQQLS